MRHWSRKAILIRRSAELVIVLGMVSGIVFYFAIGSSGVMNSVAFLETMIGGMLLIAYLELNANQRLELQERDYVHPILLRMRYAWLPLLFVYLISFIVAHQLRYLLLETVVFNVVFFIVDIVMLCIVVSLFLALLRLNRSVESDQDDDC